MNNVYKITAIVLLAYCLIITHKCSNLEKQAIEDYSTISDYKSRSQHFQSLSNAKDQRISVQNKTIAKNSKELQSLLKENSELKKVNKQIAIESQTTIRNLKAKYSQKDNVPVFIYDTLEVDKFIPIGVNFGTTFKLQDKWYSLAGIIEKEGVNLDSISFKSDFLINIGYSREKWFKKLEPKVEIVDNNPYTTITGLNNITIKENKKFYQRPIFWLSLGIVKGVLIHNKIK